MSNIIVFNYNNYFNRIVKREETVSAYHNTVPTGGTWVSFSNINFNPNDEVLTKLVINKPNTDYVDIETHPVNYLLVYDNNTVLSRWFIIDTVRIRANQWELTLKRDVLADNYTDILRATTYIEKATITDPSDPLLFNKETLEVNQIKQKEIPLKDETECGWVVGYVAHNYSGGKVESNAIISSTPDITVNGLSNWSYWNSVQSNASYSYKTSSQSDNILKVKVKWGYTYAYGGADIDEEYLVSNVSLTPTAYLGTNVVKSSYTQPSWWSDYGISLKTWLHSNYDNLPSQYAEAFASSLQGETLRSLINDNIGGTGNITVESESYINSLRALNGKTIQDSSTGVNYLIEIVEISSANPLQITSSTTSGAALKTYIDNNLNSQFQGTCTNNDVTIELSSPAYAIKLNQKTIKCTTDIPAANARYHLEDSPYDMFCIPYSDDISIYDGTDTFKCSKSIALAMGVSIAETQSSTAIYDLQILPYCPARDVIASSPIPNSVLNISKSSYNIIKDTATTPNKLSAVIWCSKSTFKVDIDQKLELPRPLYASLEEPDLGEGEYLAVNVPLWLNGFDVSNEDWQEGIYSMTSLYQSVKSDNMLVRHVRRNSDNTVSILKEYYACSFQFDYDGNTGQDNTILIADKDNRAIEELDVGGYENVDYYIVIEFKSNEVGARGLGYGYPLEKIFNYCYFSEGEPRAIDIKLNNECNMYRLCSPNYAGAFEFSVAKSKGVEGFIAECTYKPFNPYIHVTPKLKGLYGENYVNIDDARGLICSGDFSLPALSNAWANYELQNKNYEAMFNRQIENLDVNNSIARTQALWSIGAGTLQGGVSGATAGAMAGGGYGAIAGAVAGTAGSLLGGIADYSLLKQQQAENRDFTIDMHEYSLQNIKAIPSTITKTSALVYNTRIWPFVEIYTCTDKELNAFINMLKYKGMSVLRIGNIEEFKVANEYNFIKGQMIRSNIVDGHVAQEVYNEINKGVFI